jgi:hypothetical protein
MSNEHFASIAMNSRNDAKKLFPRVLFFSFVLLLSHVLDLKPSDLDAGGVKLAVKDVVVIRGGIAVLLLYHFWMLASSAFGGAIYFPLNMTKRMMVMLVAEARKPYVPDGRKRKLVRRTPSEVKRTVWWWLFVYNLFMAPFILVSMAIVMVAMFIGFSDVYGLGTYLVNRLIEAESI